MAKNPTDAEVDDSLLSAMVDGELPAEEADRACARWRADVTSRRKWHEYQLIGDVLRSGELARGSAHELALFERIKVELASQPVVLAPDARDSQRVALDGHKRHPAESRTPTSGWAWGAVAAGILAVSGTWILTQETSSNDLGNVIAFRGAQVPASVAASAAASAVGEPVIPVSVSSTLVPDPKLDPYLSAHKQFSVRSFTGSPSSSLRQVATEVPGR